MTNSSRITGNDAAEGADPGGTHSTKPGTKPGNPDKSGPSKPGKVSEDQKIVSGDRNAGRPDELAQDPN